MLFPAVRNYVISTALMPPLTPKHHERDIQPVQPIEMNPNI